VRYGSTVSGQQVVGSERRVPQRDGQEEGRGRGRGDHVRILPRYAPRMLATVIAAMFSAFITGALARFAVPGPDPMPAWLTIVIGFAGTAIGWGIVYASVGNDPSWAGIASFLAAVTLVVLYRRFVQKRALWGPEAYRFPERGVGVQQYRQRLQRAGIDPDRVGAPFGGAAPGGEERVGPFPQPRPVAVGEADDPSENPAHYLRLLDELHDAGVLDDEEYGAARARLLERLRG
jgi:uncharacterized membrane protein YeaQ/YmgE (transglycosylase-associated protein family)